MSIGGCDLKSVDPFPKRKVSSLRDALKGHTHLGDSHSFRDTKGSFRGGICRPLNFYKCGMSNHPNVCCAMIFELQSLARQF